MSRENLLRPWQGHRVIVEIPEQGKLPCIGRPEDWLDADNALREAYERGYRKALLDIEEMLKKGRRDLDGE